MANNQNLKENGENVNTNFEKELELQKIKVEVLKKFSEYKQTLNFMATDAPIEVLCLPRSIEKILIDHGFLRIYDLFDVDFVKIKGLGETRIRHLTTCLDKFFSML